jgi:hypothetical protein
MYLNSKTYVGTLCLVCAALVLGRAQDTTSVDLGKGTNQVQIRVAGILPKALGNNFLSKAYDVKAGGATELLVFCGQHYFLGYQGAIKAAEVDNPSLVGQFNRSTIQHHYVQGGYSFFPKENELGLTLGVGAGFAHYKNSRNDVKFHDNGFSLMANTTINYRLSSFFGVMAGVQYAHDLMNTITAPEVKSFFDTAQTLHYSVGIVMYVKR